MVWQNKMKVKYDDVYKMILNVGFVLIILIDFVNIHSKSIIDSVDTVNYKNLYYIVQLATLLLLIMCIKAVRYVYRILQNSAFVDKEYKEVYVMKEKCKFCVQMKSLARLLWSSRYGVTAGSESTCVTEVVKACRWRVNKIQPLPFGYEYNSGCISSCPLP